MMALARDNKRAIICPSFAEIISRHSREALVCMCGLLTAVSMDPKKKRRRVETYLFF